MEADLERARQASKNAEFIDDYKQYRAAKNSAEADIRRLEKELAEDQKSSEPREVE